MSGRPSYPPGTAAHAIPHPVHDPPRVLVAEDDADMRRLVVEALEADGCIVASVPDGGRLLVEIAHQCAREFEAIDLIVSDIRMPVASGLRIVEALRTIHCWTPVILMTAFGDDATRAQAEMLGTLLFDKPFEVDDLRAAARSLLHPVRGRGRLEDVKV